MKNKTVKSLRISYNSQPFSFSANNITEAENSTRSRPAVFKFHQLTFFWTNSILENPHYLNIPPTCFDFKEKNTQNIKALVRGILNSNVS